MKYSNYRKYSNRIHHTWYNKVNWWPDYDVQQHCSSLRVRRTVEKFLSTSVWKIHIMEKIEESHHKSNIHLRHRGKINVIRQHKKICFTHFCEMSDRVQIFSNEKIFTGIVKHNRRSNPWFAIIYYFRCGSNIIPD